jgi:hypothetical protein
MSIDEVLDKLVRDVEASVHAFYRGDVRQNTQRVRTDTFRNAARQSLVTIITEGGGATSIVTPPTSGGGLAPDEIAAATRCVMAWQSIGNPGVTSLETRCIPAAREIVPTWAEREKARLALKRVAG